APGGAGRGGRAPGRGPGGRTAGSPGGGGAVPAGRGRGGTWEESCAGYWAHLGRRLRERGVPADPARLRELPHDVVLADRLRARLARGWAAGGAAPRPAPRVARAAATARRGRGPADRAPASAGR